MLSNRSRYGGGELRVSAGTTDRAASDLRRQAAHRVRWFACYTSGRHEKRVSERLDSAGFESYLPVISVERQWSDRVKRVETPVFPSYVFSRFRAVDVAEVWRIQGVVSVVGDSAGPHPIRDEEIEQVRRVLEFAAERGLPTQTECQVRCGIEVTVTDGPLRGVKGIVLQLRGKTHVLVRLHSINRGVAIEVPLEILRPTR